MNQAQASPVVLVAPLDWGLGHATRLIPIIRELLVHNCTVLIAASGKGKLLLQQEFPQLSFLAIHGYNIRYAASGWGLAIKIVAQIPKLLSAIKKEQAWLEKVVSTQKVDAVIADNRYGLSHTEIVSIFITHQLQIKAPLKSAEVFLRWLNYRYIHKFSACWVPDVAGRTNLAGLLSHPAAKPAIPLVYTGWLSRFKSKQLPTDGGYLLVLLSGPEPQRTLLENILLHDLKSYTKPVVFVRGLPGSAGALPVHDNVTVYNHLPAVQLEEKILHASFVVSRCGYSTVMDLATLQKKSILIPTPGQTEQQYLAGHLMQQQFALCMPQQKFRLQAALALAASFAYRFSPPVENNLTGIVHGFVETIKEIKASKAKQSSGT